MKSLISFLAGFFMLSSFLSCKNKESVDLIVHNGVIYTVDSALSVQEAFAVKNGKFHDIGTSEDILNKYTSEHIVNAAGEAIYPGFYDAHCHFFGLAQGMHQVDLVGAASMKEVIQRIQAFRAKFPNDAWIIGRGWDQNLWADKSFPNNDELNAAFPDVPVYLSRIDGHAALVNQTAFDLAHIDMGKQPEGGLIVHKGNRPTGVLVDNAMDLVQQEIPAPSDSQLTNLLQEAEKACFSVGLTSLADAGLSRKRIDLLKELYKEKKLRIGEYAMAMLDTADFEQILKEGIFEQGQLTMRSFKIIADGALGSRGACLLHPYEDAPTQGFLLQKPAVLDAVIGRIAKSDFQVNVHAIGDSTNRFILHVFNKHLGNNSSKRWRVEHAQIVQPEDYSLFTSANIIPSVQPSHATSDMNWAKDRLGRERLPYAYAYKRLLQAAGMVALGSDFPVEDINPLYQFHAAVARTDKGGQPTGGFQVENALTREEALQGLTNWAAYACFQEETKGSITKGKQADFVRLEKDIMQIPLHEIRSTKVKQTWVAGEKVYQNK
ncbi:amidohydrolase [Olivibacter sp. XZL3]|uniref:amidohydrolase n=1 Tax=Olivibacter sp. XZL3 TaxID=1735116 RepID=UPI00106576F1|nr:amidohydrolase [Olivibacter sp. XZL3]